MVLDLRRTDKDGLIFEMESESTFLGYQYVTDLLSQFYAKRGANLVVQPFEKGFAQKRTWFLPVVYKGEKHGDVKIIYVTETHPFQKGRGWTAHLFQVYFKFKNEEISNKERERCYDYLRPGF